MEEFLTFAEAAVIVLVAGLVVCGLLALGPKQIGLLVIRMCRNLKKIRIGPFFEVEFENETEKDARTSKDMQQPE